LAGFYLVVGLTIMAGGAVAASAEGWLSRYADEMTGWVLGVVGVVLALNAARPGHRRLSRR